MARRLGEHDARIEDRAAWVKYGLLAFVLVYYFTTRDFQIYRYVERVLDRLQDVADEMQGIVIDHA